MSFQSNTFNLTFPDSTDFDLWFQAYCLNPPVDSCDFGPCPNTDVTGRGQQISLYISSTVLLVVLIYSPTDIENAIYPYLVSIYALLISALISFSQSNLTQNDTVFVLVMVASPATLYLWTSYLFLPFRRLPSRNIVGINKSHKAFLSTAILGSCLMWFVMIGITFRGHISFSQPSCNKDFGTQAWINLLWPSAPLVQLVILQLFMNASITLFCRFACDHRTPPFENLTFKRITLDSDLLHWTANAWTHCWPWLKKGYRGIFFFLLFLQVLVTLPFFIPTISQAVLIMFLLAPLVLNPRKVYGIKKLVPLYQVMIIVFITILLGPIIMILSTSSLPLGIVLGTSLPGSTWSLLPFGFWACPWVCSSFLRTKQPQTLLEKQQKIWYQMSRCGPYWEFVALIIIPTQGWITAVLVGDPVISEIISFGQFFAILTSIIPFWTFLSLCWKRRWRIKAVFSATEIEPNEMVIPLLHITPEQIGSLQLPEPNHSVSPTFRETAIPSPSHDQSFDRTVIIKSV